ncbi:hypothetical protein [Azorhizobium caulinodans]|uniref:hypothetical protein n=1 Tax=Azorhizobium caulinodans TaxID=7 RepID=UPI002FBD6709
MKAYPMSVADQRALLARLPVDHVTLGLYWDGEALLVPPAAVPIIDAALTPEAVAAGARAELADLQQALCADLDEAAEARRARLITLGAGQAMTYQAKAAEAQRLADDAAPDPASYPLLSAEVGLTADDLAGVGAAVRGANAAWIAAGAAIERVRLAGKRDIRAAGDVAAVRAAFAAVIWPEA